MWHHFLLAWSIISFSISFNVDLVGKNSLSFCSLKILVKNFYFTFIFIKYLHWTQNSRLTAIYFYTKVIIQSFVFSPLLLLVRLWLLLLSLISYMQCAIFPLDFPTDFHNFSLYFYLHIFSPRSPICILKHILKLYITPVSMSWKNEFAEFFSPPCCFCMVYKGERERYWFRQPFSH